MEITNIIPSLTPEFYKLLMEPELSAVPSDAVPICDVFHDDIILNFRYSSHAYENLTEKAVRLSAYFAWEKAGRPENMADHFWHEAEK